MQTTHTVEISGLSIYSGLKNAEPPAAKDLWVSWRKKACGFLTSEYLLCFETLKCSQVKVGDNTCCRVGIYVFYIPRRANIYSIKSDWFCSSLFYDDNVGFMFWICADKSLLKFMIKHCFQLFIYSVESPQLWINVYIYLFIFLLSLLYFKAISVFEIKQMQRRDVELVKEIKKV